MKPAYQHDGKPISADAFYQIACDPRRHVAVEACAGAGKTWLLVSRIVRALLDGTDVRTGELGVEPHEILAITFTKRAAAEMRERLHQWLQQFAHAPPEILIEELVLRGVDAKSDPLLLSNMAASLSKLYERVLVSGRQVQIRTFHSWFAALLRSAPLAVVQRLELPVNYELLENDSQAKVMALRHFFKKVSDHTSLKEDYAALVFEQGRSQAEKALLTVLNKRVEFALSDARGVVDASVRHFSTEYPDLAAMEVPEHALTQIPAHQELLTQAARALGGASAPSFSAKGVELEMALAAGDLPSVFLAILTKDGAARKFGEKIAGIEVVRQAQSLALRIMVAMKQHTAWLHQQRMARLSRALLVSYREIKHQHGWVDMNDVERAAQMVLGDATLSGWVQLRLDAQIKHLMVDEFQDTNPLQWQALLSWLGSYAGSGGGSAPSVFLVGDPKQSIYRFRRAEPQVFQAAKAFVRDGLGGDLLSCDHTRRNAEQVISTVNAVMLAAQAAGEFDGFRVHTTGAASQGHVCTLAPIARDGFDAGGSAPDPTQWRDSLTEPQVLPEDSLHTLEARQAAVWVAQQIEGGMRPQDIMVLSRKRASLGPVHDELRKLNVASQIGESTELFDCCEVQDVVALLDVLVSPQHDLSLARVLKSPFFSVDDSDLIQLALMRQKLDAPWFHLLQRTSDLPEALKPLAPVLNRWKTWVDELPPHDALQAIFDDGDVLARFAQVAPESQRNAVLANLRALPYAALQLGGGRFATPYGFVRALKAGGVLAPAAVVETAVRLLTVHGAKGLEAHVVLLLDTDSKERNADTMSVLVDWPGEAAWPVKFVFLVSESNPPACAQDTLNNELAQRRREEINTLYVAMTRARHTLAISSIEPVSPNEDSWWARLARVPDPARVRGVAERQLHLPQEVAVRAFDEPDDGRRLQSHFFIKELPASVNIQSGADVGPAFARSTNTSVAETEIESISARIGTAMHRLLEWGDTGESSAAVVARQFDLTPEQAHEAATMALRILHGDGAWIWRADRLSWDGNEVELWYRGELLRLDRLVQRRDTLEWWVLDYKSAAAPQNDPALVAQLSKYRSAVQAIYSDAQVRAAFLTGQGTLIELSKER